MPARRPKKLTAHTTRCIAAASATDPRTVRRFVKGQPMKSTTQARVERAIIELGFDHLLGRRR